MKRLIVFGLLAVLAALPFLNGCQEVEGALVMKPIKLTLTAPVGNLAQPSVRADRYRVYYTNNPKDFQNKPLSQIPTLLATNAPGVPGTPDSMSFQHLFQTGRQTYYKAVAEKDIWVQVTPDTLNADSTLQTVASQALSNYAWRYFPPEPNDKPANVNNLN